jgi:hypothetical protein
MKVMKEKELKRTQGNGADGSLSQSGGSRLQNWKRSKRR